MRNRLRERALHVRTFILIDRKEPQAMAGKIEIRKSGEKFRYVVLNSRGDKVLQGPAKEDKAEVKRNAASLVKAVSGAEIVDATKRTAAGAAKAKTPPARRAATAGRKS